MTGEWKNPDAAAAVASIHYDMSTRSMTIKTQSSAAENLHVLRKCLAELTPPLLTGKKRRLHHSFNFGTLTASVTLLENEWDTVLDHLIANNLLTTAQAEQVYRSVPFHDDNFFKDMPVQKAGMDQVCVLPPRLACAFEKITYRKAIDRMTVYLRPGVLSDQNRDILLKHVRGILHLTKAEFDARANAFIIFPGHKDRAKRVMQAISCTPVSAHPDLLPIKYAHFINRTMNFERDIGPPQNEGDDKDKLKASGGGDGESKTFVANAGGGGRGGFGR